MLLNQVPNGLIINIMYSFNTKYDGPYTIESSVKSRNYNCVKGQHFMVTQKDVETFYSNNHKKLESKKTL